MNIAPNSRPRYLAALVVAGTLSMVTSCCSSGVSAERSGPEFAVSFPDPQVLVETTDVAGTRAVLAQVWLPATEEHHQMLRRMLDEQDTISAGHLQLLVEAVSFPEEPNLSLINNEVFRYPQRGTGPYAHVSDELLMAGMAKLSAVQARGFGLLLGRAQSDETLRAFADEWLPKVDDGSVEAVEQMLGGLYGSPVYEPFVFDYLVDTGRLDGERGWQVVKTMSFDSGKVRLVRALAGRNEVIEAARLLEVVEALGFDDGRGDCVDELIGKVPELSVAQALRLVEMFSFDSGRKGALEAVAKSGKLAVDEDQLLAFVKLFSFDSGRVEALGILLPHVQGEATEASATGLLDAMSFDSARMSTVEVMAARWRKLGPDARERLLEKFSFDSEQKRARRQLR